MRAKQTQDEKKLMKRMIGQIDFKKIKKRQLPCGCGIVRKPLKAKGHSPGETITGISSNEQIFAFCDLKRKASYFLSEKIYIHSLQMENVELLLKGT